jgi:amidohydrolase
VFVRRSDSSPVDVPRPVPADGPSTVLPARPCGPDAPNLPAAADRPGRTDHPDRDGPGNEAFDEHLVALRRDLHRYPELGHQEVRTTRRVLERLRALGLDPVPLPGTGLVCDIGVPGPTVALRADLDALPLQETSGQDFASQVPGVCHACGHDVHTTAVLGAGILLTELHREGRLPGRVRLIFQPAEEVLPGGALKVLESGALDGVDRAYALHCDPHRDVGTVATRTGAITAAADIVRVELHGEGGHTSRPHLTGDLVFALAHVATGVPAVLSRRMDPRAGTTMVWGRINAGTVANAVPATGEIHGTLRCLDPQAWAAAGTVVADAVRRIVEPYGLRARIHHTRGVPPAVNDPQAVQVIERTAVEQLGRTGFVQAEQSLGGEDFAWILEKVPGALFRLGTRTPGGRTHDLHQGDLVIDERAVGLGARLLAGTAVCDLDERCWKSR